MASSVRRIALAFLLLIAACDGSPKKPMISFLAGGISFDPAHSHANLTLVVRQVKPLPAHGRLTAELQFPDARLNRSLALPVTAGQLTYSFAMEFAADPGTSNNFTAKVMVVDANGMEVAVITRDFGASIDKHELPRNADMIPDRERQVEQLNDEGF